MLRSVEKVDEFYLPPTGEKGEIRLVRGDCLYGMQGMASGSVDMVVTSPPYNVQTRYSTYDDTISRPTYLDWIVRTLGVEVQRLLGPKGSLFLNMGSVPTNPWGPFEVVSALRPYFHLQNVFHWIKSIYVESESYGKRVVANVGHYKPINSPRFVNDCHEYVFHLTKTGDVPLDRLAVGVPYKDDSNESRWEAGGSKLRCRGNVWYVPYRTIQSREDERPHPASFPVELAEMAIKIHGVKKKETRVLDPFNGIGNTTLAAFRLGVQGLGFEIDPSYFETSVRILQEESA